MLIVSKQLVLYWPESWLEKIWKIVLKICHNDWNGGVESHAEIQAETTAPSEPCELTLRNKELKQKN